MEGTNEDTLISIRYYQERLEKYSRNKNEDKILYVISKLERLPIKTFHLENTGVGRSVNGLKKMGGNIAEAAKNLVAQWKDMVREEERNSEIQETVNEETAANCSYSSEENYAQHEYIQHNMNEEYQKSSSDNDSFREDRQPKSSDKDRNNQNYELEDINRKENRHKSKNGEGNNDTEEPKHKDNKNKEKASAKIHDREDTKTKTNDGKNRHKTDDKREKKHKSDRSSKVNEEESGQKYHRHDKNGERLKNEDKYVHSHAHEKIHVHEGSSKSSVPKSSNNDRAIKSEHKSRNKDKESSSVEKEKKSKHKSKHSSSREKERKQKRRHSSSEMSDTDDTKPKLKKSKPDVKVETKHKSRELETNTKTKEKLKLDKHKSTEKLVNGIDSHSGASFAEALGMCATIVSSKNSTKKKSEKTNILEKNGLSSKHSIEQDEEEEDDVPTLLKQPNLEPLNLNIASLLPEITPNYRPLGLPIDSQPRRILTDDEALSRVMMNKNQRTKVYSGNKSHGKVETLFDLCVRVLQDNIDALEYTGGVPYIILKPVLEKATADQLFNMEHHNPYLVEDTDYLWKRHCEKQFRTKNREELESWRDMYMRCLDEREARLNAITANIKQSQDKSVPIRTTKLAYLDSVVKPPRNIARKQAKNGICEKKPLTPTERLSLLSKSGEASKVTVPNPGGRAVERHSSSTSVLKQKKAPLMAKTLSLFKNRFKR